MRELVWAAMLLGLQPDAEAEVISIRGTVLAPNCLPTMVVDDLEFVEVDP